MRHRGTTFRDRKSELSIYDSTVISIQTLSLSSAYPLPLFLSFDPSFSICVLRWPPAGDWKFKSQNSIRFLLHSFLALCAFLSPVKMYISKNNNKNTKNKTKQKKRISHVNKLDQHLRRKLPRSQKNCTCGCPCRPLIGCSPWRMCRSRCQRRTRMEPRAVRWPRLGRARRHTKQLSNKRNG